MAGSGVNPTNALEIASTGINNIHFTARKPVGTNTKLSMGDVIVVDEEKIEAIMGLF